MVEPEGLEAENERIVRNCYNAYLNHDIWTVVDACAEDLTAGAGNETDRYRHGPMPEPRQLRIV